MKKEILKSIKSVRRSAAKHSPEILTGLGVAGMITTTVLAVKATPKALELIRQKEEDNSEYIEAEDDWRTIPLTKKGIVKTTWKCYVPAVITGSVSIACLIGASSVNARRNAALATAYTLSESALKDYRNKVIETMGKEKDKEIKESIDRDKIKKNPPGNCDVIVADSDGVLCYDSISGRYFKSTVNKLEKIQNELNRRMMDEIYITLNELYYELNLPSTKIGDELGWNLNRGLIELSFGTQLSDDDKPCIVLDYRVAPKYDFKNY